MKIFIFSILLIFAGNSFAKCDIDDQINAAIKKRDDANDKRATIFYEYKQNCTFGDITDRSERIDEHVCWVCSPSVYMLIDPTMSWYSVKSEDQGKIAAFGSLPAIDPVTKKLPIELTGNNVPSQITLDKCPKIDCASSQRVFRILDLGIFGGGGEGVGGRRESETEDRLHRGFIRIGKDCNSKPDKIETLTSAKDACSGSCNSWFANEAEIKAEQDSITSLQTAKLSLCGDSTCTDTSTSAQCVCTNAGKTWSTNTNTCCEDTTNVAQCKCEADLKHKWNTTTLTCDPTGSGDPTTPPDPTTPSDPTYAGNGLADKNKKSGATDSSSTTAAGTDAQTPAGTGSITATAPGGASGIAGDGKSWYDKAISMLNPGSGGSSTGNFSARPGSGKADSITSASNPEDNSPNKKSTGISSSANDIFKIVTSMYRNRYFSGLIGDNIKAGTTKSNIKVGKKPVTYK